MPLPTPETHVVCHVLDTGHCLAHESMMIRGGRRLEVECHSLVALIWHPQHGWGLWDTGYAPRMEQETARWPFRLFRYATPLRLRPELAAAAQLWRWGLAPADLRWIVLSHLHADHVAGLRDFSAARIFMTSAAYDHINSRRGWRAVARGYVPRLLPDDLSSRATLIHEFAGQPLPVLGPTYDLFGDRSLLLVQLPGHARGQVGLLAHTAERKILFAADGAWLTRSIRERRLPHPLTYLLIDDRRELRRTLDKLHDFARQYSDIALIPTHCPEAYACEVAR
ncbi:MAG TPA: MBL fold metallo-hydrolase [Roseiflexaceae bacterium]|nr:MBL fold metallo-hydrolase [Roseiflexaceae bacterium]